jgi:4'-phosphopantetheinyl transferase EntD
MSGTELDLSRALAALAVPGVELGARRIADRDERELLPAELGSLTTRLRSARAASGAARAAARELLERLGEPRAAVPKGAGGAPVWPAGLVGSLAHDGEVALAALARSERVAALGVDVEPAEPLGADVLEIVATPDELEALGDHPCAGRAAFVAKEAVYKALNPLDGIRLEYADIRLDFRNGRAVTRAGRVVDLRYCIAERIVALAYVTAEAAARQRRLA